MKREDILNTMSQQVQLTEYWNDLVRENKIEDNRHQKNVMYRNAFMMAAREYSSLGITDISRILERHHATVIHAQKHHDSNLRFSKIYRNAYQRISSHLSDMFILEVDFSEYNGLKDENNQLRNRLMSMSRRNRNLIMESKFHEEIVNELQKKVDQLKEDNYEKQMSLNMLNKKLSSIVF
jgi:hypothetical protein